MRAKYVLDRGNYPGDKKPGQTAEPDRFFVYAISEGRHVIMNKEDRRAEELTVLTDDLLNPKFCLAEWYIQAVGKVRQLDARKLREWRRRWDRVYPTPMGTPLVTRVEQLLAQRARYDNDPTRNAQHPERFACTWMDDGTYLIRDYIRSFAVKVPVRLLLNPKFELASWYNKMLLKAHRDLRKRLGQSPTEFNMLRLLERGALTELECQLEDVARNIYTPTPDAKFLCDGTRLFAVELNGQQIPAGTYPALQRGAAITKDFKRVIPRPVVVVVNVNGRPAHALVDSGSLSDFMSVTLADQLKLKKTELTKPLVVQLAVQGSRSKVNYG
ncbi:hypothetical protein P692DRAFT_20759004, partial [Suillus brevipes Sb2]